LNHVKNNVERCEYCCERYGSGVNFHFFTSDTGVSYGGTGGGPLTRLANSWKRRLNKGFH
jgi:hypothetical protein